MDKNKILQALKFYSPFLQIGTMLYNNTLIHNGKVIPFVIVISNSPMVIISNCNKYIWTSFNNEDIIKSFRIIGKCDQDMINKCKCVIENDIYEILS